MKEYRLIKKGELLERINERIYIGEKIFENFRNNGNFIDDDCYLWHQENCIIIKNYFDPQENELTNKILNHAASARTFMDVAAGKNNGIENEILDRLSNLKLFNKLLRHVKEDSNTNSEFKKSENYDLTKVFIVHGHDKGLLSEVARIVQKVGLIAIILNEQANEGKTVIEKFEANSDVGYAIILLSPDDIGSVVEGVLKPRARQNVIFEMGYFFAKLGRERVFNLIKDTVEQPSDLDGILYNKYIENWEFRLGKELLKLGYRIKLEDL